MKKAGTYFLIPAIVLMFSYSSELWAGEKIGALGRIKPRGDILHLFGPGGVKMDNLLIKGGQPVKKDTPLVVFATKTTAELEMMLAEISASEADRLGSIAILSQQEKIKAIDAEHKFASRRVGRFKKVGGQRLSEQQMDQRRSEASITKAKLEAAKLELEKIRLNRKLSMDRTQRQLELAKEKLKQATLIAPRDGTILETLYAEGETIGKKPVIIMADLAVMYVIADVFEGDLLNLRPGMSATITNNTFPEPLKGEVETIGRIIDPASRTAKVKIRLIDSEPASKLINMEVDVSIEF